MAVMIASRLSPIIQAGSGIHCSRILAPTTASTATTITQKYQYNQPLVNPTQLPRPIRAYSVKEPTPGSATAISPSMRITSITTMPAAR
ncbi:hypothetical protein D3C78_1413040 [compost metagenome]